MTCNALRNRFSRKLAQMMLAALALSAFAVMPAAAQGFPSKPLKVVVPQPPGGGFDFVGRLLADRLSKQLAQPVIVENRPGSGTLIGTDAVAKAAPDGYTLLVGSISNLAINPGLYRNLPYDSLRDFEPVGLAVAYSYTLMARKDLPFNSLNDLVAHAKTHPGKLTYASATVLGSMCWPPPYGTSQASSWCMCPTAARRRPTKTCWAVGSMFFLICHRQPVSKWMPVM
jgi:tripartite-type tricarboxylate transporter receptor subunit TctC